MKLLFLGFTLLTACCSFAQEQAFKYVSNVLYGDQLPAGTKPVKTAVQYDAIDTLGNFRKAYAYYFNEKGERTKVIQFLDKTGKEQFIREFIRLAPGHLVEKEYFNLTPGFAATYSHYITQWKTTETIRSANGNRTEKVYIKSVSDPKPDTTISKYNSNDNLIYYEERSQGRFVRKKEWHYDKSGKLTSHVVTQNGIVLTRIYNDKGKVSKIVACDEKGKCTTNFYKESNYEEEDLIAASVNAYGDTIRKEEELFKDNKRIALWKYERLNKELVPVSGKTFQYDPLSGQWTDIYFIEYNDTVRYEHQIIDEKYNTILTFDLRNKEFERIFCYRKDISKEQNKLITRDYNELEIATPDSISYIIANRNRFNLWRTVCKDTNTQNVLYEIRQDENRKNLFCDSFLYDRQNRVIYKTVTWYDTQTNKFDSVIRRHITEITYPDTGKSYYLKSTRFPRMQISTSAVIYKGDLILSSDSASPDRSYSRKWEYDLNSRLISYTNQEKNKNGDWFFRERHEFRYDEKENRLAEARNYFLNPDNTPKTQTVYRYNYLEQLPVTFIATTPRGREFIRTRFEYEYYK